MTFMRTLVIGLAIALGCCGLTQIVGDVRSRASAGDDESLFIPPPEEAAGNNASGLIFNRPNRSTSQQGSQSEEEETNSSSSDSSSKTQATGDQRGSVAAAVDDGVPGWLQGLPYPWIALLAAMGGLAAFLLPGIWFARRFRSSRSSRSRKLGHSVRMASSRMAAQTGLAASLVQNQLHRAELAQEEQTKTRRAA
jgi:hypothetical protein